MELKFKNGNVELAEHISHSNDRLGKIRLVNGENSEGVWAMFSPEGKKKYDEDATSGEDVVIMCNQSLSGVPWGAYVKIQYQGSERPIAACTEQFEEGHPFQYADWASASICEHYVAHLQNGTYKLEDEGLRDYLIKQVANTSESDATEALKYLLEQQC